MAVMCDLRNIVIVFNPSQRNFFFHVSFVKKKFLSRTCEAKSTMTTDEDEPNSSKTNKLLLKNFLLTFTCKKVVKHLNSESFIPVVILKVMFWSPRLSTVWGTKGCPLDVGKETLLPLLTTWSWIECQASKTKHGKCFQKSILKKNWIWKPSSCR